MTTMTSEKEEFIPPKWYRQFWPWFLISFPAIAVIAGIITTVIAVKSNDGLVNDDYYKAGLAINKTLTHVENAKALNLSADTTWDGYTQAITLKLQGNLSTLPPQLSLTLAHATRANQDQNITLYLAPDKKSYSGRSKEINSGHWHIILQPKDSSWRIKGRAMLPKQTQWQLTAN